jgi:hypothetical protein
VLAIDSGATVSGVTIKAGATLELFGGIPLPSGVTIPAGATLGVGGGVYSGLVVSSGHTLKVLSGGTDLEPPSAAEARSSSGPTERTAGQRSSRAVARRSCSAAPASMPRSAAAALRPCRRGASPSGQRSTAAVPRSFPLAELAS